MRIERCIERVNSIENGTLYNFVHPETRVYTPFMTLAMARRARKEYDWDKVKWSKVGLHNVQVFKGDSTLQRDEFTGKWYAQREMEDDVLVSDLYSRKEDAKHVKKYLDSKDWNINALNKQKNKKAHCSFKYFGILPTRDGYVIRTEKKMYGPYELLEEAYLEKMELVDRGIKL